MAAADYQKTLDISEDSLIFSTPLASTTIFWSSVQTVAYTPEHVFLKLQDQSEIAIPNRVFTNDADLQTFKTMASVQTQTGSQQT